MFGQKIQSSAGRQTCQRAGVEAGVLQKLFQVRPEEPMAAAAVVPPKMPAIETVRRVSSNMLSSVLAGGHAPPTLHQLGKSRTKNQEIVARLVIGISDELGGWAVDAHL